MSGETNLETLLNKMQPEIVPGEYVFCSIPYQAAASLSLETDGTCREKEGLSVVLLREDADRSGLKYDGSFAKITLNIHSSLQAVGLTAVTSTALAEKGVSVNVVAGCYHDHFFVQHAKSALALETLEGLMKPERACDIVRRVFPNGTPS